MKASRYLISVTCLAVMILSGPVMAEETMLPVHYEADTGRVLLEVRDLDEPLIYTNNLAAGLGTSGPLLDRGQMGHETLVRFKRRGNRVLLVDDNTDHRALGDNEQLQRSVEQSFPRSVLAAFEIQEARNGTLMVDATDFFLSDVFDIAQRMRSANLGRPSLDTERSYIEPDYTAAFPKNSEIRAVLTFAVDEPSSALRDHAPDPRSVTFEQQHSFLRLPDNDYQPREFHPRAGIFPHVFFDFAQGHDSDYRQRWLWRWRLVPSDKEAYLDGELVEPEEPIVFYMDPAIPEPYRSTFIEGSLWFNDMFEAAGFKNALRIKDLPEDADPMDIRYNMIHWVHRRERGPSVGPSHKDPRTGEIIHAIVRMDSFRSLVNHDIWMGFRPAAGPDGLALSSEEMAMQRRLQHTAHELGHALGLAHNFIAATHDRASVMDYPVPLVRLDENGYLDIADAYAPGPGPHDKLAIRYAYTWFPDKEAEREGLAEIMSEAQEDGLRFITGGAAQPDGSFPDASVWVEGEDMLSALDRTLGVRQALINAFDDRALDDGEPYSFLDKRFAHVYLHHRTALQGAIKYLGGMEFVYALKGEQVEPTRRIPPEEQTEALSRILETLEPSHLRVPDSVADQIAATPFGWDWNGEDRLFHANTGPAFDPLYAAHSLAQQTVDGLLHPERFNRVVSFHARDNDFPEPAKVLDQLVDTAFEHNPGTADNDPQDPYLVRIVQRAVVDGLLDLAGHEQAHSEARALIEARLKKLEEELKEGWLTIGRDRAPATNAHRATLRRDIQRYFDGQDDPAKRPRPEPIHLPWP
ncbi:zinc-dependent metalloprotease [Natronospira sp.]